MTTRNRRPAYYNGAAAADSAAILPAAGERLQFGLHRLAAADRTCPAWPRSANPFARTDGQVARWARGAAGEISNPNCADCGGPVTYATGGTRSVAIGPAGDTFRHPEPVYRAGAVVSACNAYRDANPPEVRAAEFAAAHPMHDYAVAVDSLARADATLRAETVRRADLAARVARTSAA